MKWALLVHGGKISRVNAAKGAGLADRGQGLNYYLKQNKAMPAGTVEAMLASLAAEEPWSNYFAEAATTDNVGSQSGGGADASSSLGVKKGTTAAYLAAHRAAFDAVAAGLPTGGQRQLVKTHRGQYGVNISQATVSRASRGAATGATYEAPTKRGPQSKIPCRVVSVVLP